VQIPKVEITRKNRWKWIALFAIVAVLLFVLATGWNVVLVQDYRLMMKLAHERTQRVPWVGLVVGTLGFIIAMAGLFMMFFRLLHEMRLNQQQSEFLATVSHELKTPLATIELSAELLRTGNLSADEARELWNSHEAELRRLKEGVGELLEAARWDSTGVPILESRVHLESWLKDSLERWRKMLGPHAQLEREGVPLDCDVMADRGLLNLITDNLLDNARKFSRNSSPKITIRSKMDNKGWKLEVKDYGWGFDPNESDNIFKRFVRAESGAPYAVPGTGLGLYLASSASRAMKMQLHGESAGKGKGATFVIEGRHGGAHV
jgi:signal transduction histidine kinase